MRTHSVFFRIGVVTTLAVLLLIQVATGVPAAPLADGGGPLVYHVYYSPLVVTTAPDQRARDDELVFLQSNGRITVADPHVPSGSQAVSWQSPGTGWNGVILGDFNGDGDQEILAFKGGHAELFDPIVQSGQVVVYGEWNMASPYEWYNMAAGDIDADGRDEIVLLRSDDAPGQIKSRLLVFDGNSAGTSWTRIQNLGHGTTWDDMAMGDVNADGREDIGLIRDEDKLLLILNPANWSRLHEASYNFPWLDLELINTHRGSGADKTEIVLSRREVEAALPSVLVFRWSWGTSISDVWQGHFYPYFTDIEGADLNGDGDEEIIMYRDRSDVEITLASRNIAGAGMRAFEPAGTNSPGGGWLNVKAGDLDGDGRDEVILVRSSKYRVYDRPETSDHFYEVAGSFRRSFAVGDLDG